MYRRSTEVLKLAGEANITLSLYLPCQWEFILRGNNELLKEKIAPSRVNSFLEELRCQGNQTKKSQMSHTPYTNSYGILKCSRNLNKHRVQKIFVYLCNTPLMTRSLDLKRHRDLINKLLRYFPILISHTVK